jgi:alanine-glyoxylate transaminase/(R)-3-amino-2-methylpropionate-pyruvate transaminase
VDTQTILEKQKEYLWPSHITYYSQPVPFARGEGMHLYDVEGKEYLDFFAGILTVSVGHCHPKVTEAIAHQAETLVHTSTLYPNEQHVKLAEKLAAMTPGRLQKSYILNSGTEANEAAVMLAKEATGEQEIVALRHGYSGRSALAMSLSGQGGWRIGGTQVAGIKHALAPYCYRCPLKLTYPECGIACAEDVEELIKTTTSGQVAAFLAEPIQGVGGFVTPPPEYFEIAVGIVRDHGGLFICDEVQTGFGRTGKHWFGIEHWGVEPDIVTMAKGIANGSPMGVTIAKPEIADKLEGLTISTFGGNPVSCAAALATIEVIEEEADPDYVERVGSHLRRGLEALQEKYPVIGDVRGKGLMQGVELVRDRETKEPAPGAASHLMEAARERGLIIGKGGLYGNAMRIAPPLIATDEDVAQALETLDCACTEVQQAV